MKSLLIMERNEMSIAADSFDIESISRSDMKLLANHIENYLMVLKEIMIIPEELMSNKEEIDDSIKIIKKLIKKLREEDMNVFNDCN
jgi:hypothetical protein